MLRSLGGIPLYNLGTENLRSTSLLEGHRCKASRRPEPAKILVRHTDLPHCSMESAGGSRTWSQMGPRVCGQHSPLFYLSNQWQMEKFGVWPIAIPSTLGSFTSNGLANRRAMLINRPTKIERTNDQNDPSSASDLLWLLQPKLHPFRNVISHYLLSVDSWPFLR